MKNKINEKCNKRKINNELIGAGFDSRLNQPWSGKDGFMYAVDNVATATRKAVMIEFRQDLVVDPEWRARVQRALIPAVVNVCLSN